MAAASAHDFVTLVRRIDATLADAQASRGGKDSATYAKQLFVTAFDDLAGLARKYNFTAEARDPNSLIGFPVIGTPALREALTSVSERLKACAEVLGVGAGRLADTLDQWLASNDPFVVPSIDGHAKTIARNLRRELSGK